MPRVIVRDLSGGVTTFPASGLPYDIPNNAFVQAIQDYLEGYAQGIAYSGFANHVPTTTPIVASDSLTGDAYSEVIIGGTLGTAGLVKRALCGYISTDDATPGGLTIDVSYGTTPVTLVQIDDGAMPPSLVKAPFKINIELAAKNDANVQVLYCEYIQDGNVTFLKRLDLVEASGSNKNLKVTVTMTVASSNNIVAIESGG